MRNRALLAAALFLCAATTSLAQDTLRMPATGSVTQNTKSQDHYANGVPWYKHTGAAMNDANGVQICDGTANCGPVPTPEVPSPNYLRHHIYKNLAENVGTTNHYHMGLDIDVYANSMGRSVVYAAGWGVLTRTNNVNNEVIIAHGGGLTTHYLHMSVVYPASGANVQPGTIIGNEGTVGYSTAPHLHFEVRSNGVRQHLQLLAQYSAVTMGAEVKYENGTAVTYPRFAGFAPAPPNSLSASAVSNTAISFQWAAGIPRNLTTGYRLEIKQEPYGAWQSRPVPISGQVVTSYTWTWLVPGAYYSWRVAALNVNGSATSWQASVWCGLRPGTPIILAPAIGATFYAYGFYTLIRLDWSDVAAPGVAYSYRVFRNGVLAAFGTPAASQAYASLLPGAYTWYVWAYNPAGSGGMASGRFNIAPPAPSGLTRVGTSGYWATLDWWDTAGATSYDIEVMYWTGAYWAYYGTWSAGGSATSFHPLYYYRTYGWRVRARAGTVVGPWSGWSYFYYSG